MTNFTLVDTKKAAEILGISPNTLKKYRMIGGGPEFLKFNRTVRYNIVDLQNWASRRKFNSTADYRLAGN
ncbi:MAG: helix-turn-helix domain-containing protein [Litorimonas sp.]